MAADRAPRSTPPIGSEHAAAMFRQGLHELRGALYPESNIAQPLETGIVGTITAGEVADARRNYERTLDEESTHGSVLDERLRAIEAQPAQERETRDREREV